MLYRYIGKAPGNGHVWRRSYKMSNLEDSSKHHHLSEEAQGRRPCTSQKATAATKDAAAPHAADTIPTNRRDSVHREKDHVCAMVWRRPAVARAMGGVR